MQTYPTNEYATFEDAFEALMAEPTYRESPPESAALACAGAYWHFVHAHCQMNKLSMHWQHICLTSPQVIDMLAVKGGLSHLLTFS